MKKRFAESQLPMKVVEFISLFCYAVMRQTFFLAFEIIVNTAGICLFKVDRGNIRRICEICSEFKDTKATSMTSFWCFYC